MRATLLTWIALGVVFNGCARPEPKGTKEPEATAQTQKTPPPETQKTPEPQTTPESTKTTMIDGRYFSEPGAPDPLACTKDSDCMGDTVTNAGGCCVEDPFPYPQSRSYHDWLQKRRQSEACSKAGCPPPRPPPQPPECSYKGLKCVNNKCKNSC